ncbi:MAG: PAS domain S-box protein [Proteobacteria bacterium]|nr:PAS domain S-box protein [Pseudomonadota bacterium]
MIHKENEKQSHRLSPEDRDKYFKKHVQGAFVRTIGGLIMTGFVMGFYVTGIISSNACMGGVVSGILVILMNFPALFIIEVVTTRLLFDIVSFLINLVEIIGYTSVIYFLGGIQGTFLVPVYTAVISYVGVNAPKRYPYIIAASSSLAFALMVFAENKGFLPHQHMIYNGGHNGVSEALIIVAMSCCLFGVAVITSYSSGILKATRNDLIQKNKELEESRQELKLYSHSLEKSEWKYRRVFESIQTIYLEVEKDGIIVEISPSVERVVGIKREKLIGKSVFHAPYPYPSKIRLMASEILTKGEIRDHEIQFYNAEGTVIFLSVSARVVKDEYQPEGRVVVDASDVTARHMIEMALRESEERYRMLIEELKDVVFIVTPEGFIEYTSPASIEFGGYDPDDSVGRHVSEFIASEEGIELAVEMLLEMLTHKKPLECEVLYKALNKKPFFVEVSATPILTDEDVTGVLCIMRDISHRKLAEEQVRILTQELMKIQENERKRIACDLHDDVAQNLATLMISCETFFDNYEAIPFDLKYKMKNFSGVLKRSLTFVRDLSYELRPPGLDQLGLIKTLSRYCEDFSEKHKIRADFFPMGMGVISFDPDTEINIYRLVQEALNNVKKHAEASHVVVKFVASVPDIIIRIQDNGKGFDVNERLAAAMNEKRMGLHSMTERVNFMNGKIKINAQPNEGTTIIVNIPGDRFRAPM